MNFKKKLLLLFLLFTFFIPSISLAYSDKVILGGNNIGISVDTKNVVVVGFYKVNNRYIAKDNGIMIGDYITHIDDVNVSSIEEMSKLINEKMSDDKIKLTVLRNNKSYDFILDLYEQNGIYKTGLYVKDQITGIGTLTYIDPNSKIYGALGHEIVNYSDNRMVNISGGSIFKADVIGNIKSTVTSTGEKRARFDNEVVYGNVLENTNKGIYGVYSDLYDEKRLIPVAESSLIKTGKAFIHTVLSGNVIEEYEINILKINNNSNTKNILFEITDKELINKTNGVIKGMSGSPIVQDGMLVGAVTHAIVNDNNKGYGIFITTMLKEGEN